MRPDTTDQGDPIFSGLNAEQRRAVDAVRGPVCILAGAGSGKTTTITRRIAHQVASGTFGAGSILAVTFTDKAATEMRKRLERLGISGVRARTFHSAALAQLHHLSQEPPQDVLPSKGLALRQIANTLPKPYRFRPAADLATEIEWAKNRRIPPDRYLDELGGREPPIPPDLMERVYGSYERGKRARGLVDFEDLLELAVRLLDEDPDALERLQSRYSAFTVDEYQDVNLLQQSLLEHWLGERDDLCVVGDDYQSIYSFTGASPRFLLDMPSRFARARIVKLEDNYRSTPQVLDLANLLVPGLRGASKRLRPTFPDGPRPELRAFVDASDEASHLVDRIRELKRSGIALEDMAVLYRVNFRSEDFEEALARAHIPFQVRDGAFLSRPAARRLVGRLRRTRSASVADEVRQAAQREGMLDELPEGIGEQEATRQNDLARLVRLAEEFDDGDRTIADFLADLQVRFGTEGEGRGVNLLTYHRAKGLEFEAVFLVRVQEGEIPFRKAIADEDVAEERRLFYVGITRAKRELSITWLTGARNRPSRFLAELGVGRTTRARPARQADVDGDPLLAALKEWRRGRAGRDGVPAYVVFHDSTLADIARARPQSLVGLSTVTGVGPTKLERYGEEVLGVLKGRPKDEG